MCHFTVYACRLAVVPSDAERAVAMLRYANYAKVAEALLVSRASVADWAKGKSVTPYRVRQLEQLLRPDLQAQQESPPAWAEGLVDDAIARTVRLLGGPEYPAALELLRERLEGIPPPPHEAGDAEGEAPGPGTSAPQVRRVG